MLAGEEFPIKYPDFDKNLNDLNGKFKIANKKLTELKKINLQNTFQTTKSYEYGNFKTQSNEKKLQCK